MIMVVRRINRLKQQKEQNTLFQNFCLFIKVQIHVSLIYLCFHVALHSCYCSFVRCQHFERHYLHFTYLLPDVHPFVSHSHSTPKEKKKKTKPASVIKLKSFNLLLLEYPVKLSDSFEIAACHQVLIYRGSLAMLGKKLIIKILIFKSAEEANN